jgi:hypothetical protein
MRHSYKVAASLAVVVMLCGAGSSCNDDTAVSEEQDQTDNAQQQLLRNQPIPTFDYSNERHNFIEIYKARQAAVATFSYVQSPYTGKIMWQCNSIGYPIPYATQITNPSQVIWSNNAAGTVSQAEPNGLYSPAEAAATWVPCVDSAGNITPVYEEKDVTVFLQPMHDDGNGDLVPDAGTKPSFEIQVSH